MHTLFYAYIRLKYAIPTTKTKFFHKRKRKLYYLCLITHCKGVRRYVRMPKDKLNLSIDSQLKKAIKHIAIAQDATVSELFEDYIKAIQKNQDMTKVIKQISKTNKKK